MKKNNKWIVPINRDGGLELPKNLLEQFNLRNGSTVEINLTDSKIEIILPENQLRKVYVEPTNACNLECKTCMRNAWHEQIGFMSLDTFEKFIQSIQVMKPLPLIFFGGIGEPLAHPRIREMVSQVKRIGAKVELITNGILLDDEVSKWMIDMELDRIWVSIDGARPESYTDIRLGSELPKVISNIQNLRSLQQNSQVKSTLNPKLGIAFVAMRQNLQDLPEVVRLGQNLGADHFCVSNVLPYTEELYSQMLFSRSIYIAHSSPSFNSPIISFPRFDLDESTLRVLAETLNKHSFAQFNGQEIEIPTNSCPFVKERSVSIRWDGYVSPCQSLLHAHSSMLDDTVRVVREHFMGSINQNSLIDIWNNTEFVEFRKRLIDFDFSPCTVCNSCVMAESNVEDCFGNNHPTCGGCLWAQGFIQCP